jgi:uncharacterized protein (DUF433 family)
MADAPLPRTRVPHPHVQVDAAVLGGSPHVVGSRVPVRRLWVWHRGGASVETLIKRYPNLGPARIFDALAFAYDNQELIEADIAREQALLERQGPGVGNRPLAQLMLPFDAGDAPLQAAQDRYRTSAHDVGLPRPAQSSPDREAAPKGHFPTAEAVRSRRKR